MPWQTTPAQKHPCTHLKSSVLHENLGSFKLEPNITRMTHRLATLSGVDINIPTRDKVASSIRGSTHNVFALKTLPHKLRSRSKKRARLGDTINDSLFLVR